MKPWPPSRILELKAGTEIDVLEQKGLKRIWIRERLGSKLIRKVVLPLLGVKRQMADARQYERTIEAGRLKGDARPPARMRRRFEISAHMLAGSRVYRVNPLDATSNGTIIYIHGGAYVANMLPDQWRIVAGLATRTGARVLVPNYPLAPENSWKSAYRMLTELYADTLRSTPADRISIVGDSAGAGLALGLSQRWRDEGRLLPRCLILFSPWLDARADNEAQEALESVDPILSRPGLVWAARHWAGNLPLEHPHISPGLGKISDLPPILMFSGTADLLHPDAIAFWERAQLENIRLNFVIGHKMTHAWSILPVKDASTLYDAAASFLTTPALRTELK